MTALGTASKRIARLAGAASCPHCDRNAIAGMPHGACVAAVSLAAMRSRGAPDEISRFVDAHGREAARSKFTVVYSSTELHRAFEAHMKGIV